MTAFTGRLNTVPRAYPPEFRARAIALVRAGKPQKQTADELDIHPVTLSKWVKQDSNDRDEIPGVSTTRPGKPLHHGGVGRRVPYAPYVPSLLRVEVQRLDAKHPVVGYGTHAHEFFEVLLIEAAGGVHRVNGVAEEVRRGQVWLLRPGIAHDLSELGEARGWLVIATPEALGLPPWDDGVATWVSHPLTAAFQHVSADGRPVPLRLGVRRLTRWLRLLSELDEELRTGRPGYEHAAQALLHLLLVDAARSVPAPLDAAADPLVDRALQLVDEGFRGPLSLADVAGALAVTPGHLTEMVRARSGRPLGAWILQRRMVEARVLLGETTRPVGEVALACGFSDVGHFSRQFRAVHSVSPSAWRARLHAAGRTDQRQEEAASDTTMSSP